MPLQSIIVIFLRLFAIQWFFQSLITIAISWSRSPMQMTLIISTCWLGAAGISWILAQPLARLVTKGYDTPVNFGGLTRQDLYCYAFVFVGLGFFVRGFAAVLTMLGGLFASATVSALSPGDHALLASMTDQIPRAFVQTILGLISMLFANRWAKKLIDSEK